MIKMTKLQFLFVVLFVSIVQFTSSAPVTDVHEGSDVVDEIIMRLRQLKQQSEGTQHVRATPAFYGNPQQEIYRVHRTLENLGGGYLLKRAPGMDSLGGGYLLKRSPNDTPRGTLDSLGGGYLL